jgi:hypothetical protein
MRRSLSGRRDCYKNRKGNRRRSFCNSLKSQINPNEKGIKLDALSVFVLAKFLVKDFRKQGFKLLRQDLPV